MAAVLPLDMDSPPAGRTAPTWLHGSSGIQARVRKRPYAITLRWNHQPAIVCIDMERRH